MALEDFERELAAGKDDGHKRKRDRSRSLDESTRRHHHRHSHHSKHGKHESSGHHRSHHKERSSKHRDRRTRSRSPVNGRDGDPSNNGDRAESRPEEPLAAADIGAQGSVGAQRDSWMEAPSALDIDYVQRRKPQEAPSTFVKAGGSNLKQNLHAKELEHHLNDVDEEKPAHEVEDLPAQHEVNYTIGDDGSSWRMTRLNATYKQAEDSRRSIEEVAQERYGELRAFDDAREEETELERRHIYGKGYVGKDKPNGDLFEERKLEAGMHRPERPEARDEEESEDEFEKAQGKVMEQQPAPKEALPLDQTALNKLKAQLMKAKLMKAPNAAQLEAEYNAAAAGVFGNKPSDVVVLNKMESRMLAGSRKGEVNTVDNKRGRERGLVTENEDMSIDDMVRQERRTRGQGGEGKAFAERIAKDAKFDVSCNNICSSGAAKADLPMHRMTSTTWKTMLPSWQRQSRSPRSTSATRQLATTTKRSAYWIHVRSVIMKTQIRHLKRQLFHWRLARS